MRWELDAEATSHLGARWSEVVAVFNQREHYGGGQNVMFFVRRQPRIGSKQTRASTMVQQCSPGPWCIVSIRLEDCGRCLQSRTLPCEQLLPCHKTSLLWPHQSALQVVLRYTCYKFYRLIGPVCWRRPHHGGRKGCVVSIYGLCVSPLWLKDVFMNVTDVGPIRSPSEREHNTLRKLRCRTSSLFTFY